MDQPYEGLRQFLSALEERGALARIQAGVNTDLEMAAIVRRECRRPGGGRGLLFLNPQGKAWPVAANLFGSRQRAELAWGPAGVAGPAERLHAGLSSLTGAGEVRLARLLSDPAIQAHLGSKADWNSAPRSLCALPALRSWPQEPAPYLTLAVMVTRDPRSRRPNYGLYRLQILDQTRAVVHWNPGAGAGVHHRAWARRGADMPAAIILGGPPALLAAAAMPLPPECDEAALVGLLTGVPLACAPGPLTGLPLPATAEFVLEGRISARETALEGPFGNHTGRYVPESQQPVFHLEALYHRPDPLLPATVVGPPPMEDGYLAEVNARLLLPLWQVDHPALRDMHSPREGIFHGAALLSTAEGAGAELIRSLWRAPGLRRARLLIACPPQVDIRRCEEVYWHCLNAVDPVRDLLRSRGRLGLDGTRPRSGAQLHPDEATEALLDRRRQEYFAHEC